MRILTALLLSLLLASCGATDDTSQEEIPTLTVAYHEDTQTVTLTHGTCPTEKAALRLVAKEEVAKIDHLYYHLLPGDYCLTYGSPGSFLFDHESLGVAIGPGDRQFINLARDIINPITTH